MDLGDWALTAMTAIIIGVISGIGTFFALFRNSKTEIYATVKGMGVVMSETDKGIQMKFRETQADFDRRIDKVELTIRDTNIVTNLHAVQLGELRMNQVNINNALNELRDEGHEQTKILNTLLQNGKH